MIKFIARTIWSLSEVGILPPLGRFAPYIFGLMVSVKGKRINKQ